MAETDDSQKTEQPTEKRLADARAKGQVPQSRELGHAAVLGAITLALTLSGGMAERLARGWTALLGQAGETALDPGSVGRLLIGLIGDAAGALMLPLALLCGASLAATLLQTGFTVSASNLKPSFDKVSPLAGFKRLFAIRAMVEFGKNLAKMTLVGAIAVAVISPEMAGIETVVGLDPALLLHRTVALILKVAGAVAISMTLIAIVDYVYQRLAFIKRMMMSRQEIKDETKQSEGDPAIKGRIRQLRMQRARKRMMAAVPRATVVITNPTHYAVALRYEPEDGDVPRVLAKGTDLVAQRIRETAKKHDIMLVENKPLARALYASVEIDAVIPHEHYKAVAEVISFVLRARARRSPAGAAA